MDMIAHENFLTTKYSRLRYKVLAVFAYDSYYLPSSLINENSRRKHIW